MARYSKLALTLIGVVPKSASERVKHAYESVLPSVDLAERTARAVRLAGKNIILLRLDGRVHALENRCSHMGAPFEEGPLENDELVCPWHRARFCAASGSHRGGPGWRSLASYPARERAEWIEVAAAADPLPALAGKRALEALRPLLETAPELA